MEQAAAFRKRAKDVRAIAQTMSPSLRLAMLTLADQWETLAQQAEEIAQTRADLKRVPA